MGKRDLDFKLFLVHHADELITAETGIQVEEWQPGETEPQSLTRERRLDRVFLSTGGSARLYVHFEVQNDPDRTMAHRMHEYGVRLMYSRTNPAEWWPVLSVALWPRQVPNIPEPPLLYPGCQRHGDRLALREYHHLQLDQSQTGERAAGNIDFGAIGA